jgi:hypothetical protein
MDISQLRSITIKKKKKKKGINKQASNVIDGLRERERETHSIPHTKKWWEKSSFCTHCDDGDDDACNLQQQSSNNDNNTFLSISIFLSSHLPLSLLSVSPSITTMADSLLSLTHLTSHAITH